MEDVTGYCRGCGKYITKSMLNESERLVDSDGIPHYRRWHKKCWEDAQEEERRRR